MDLLYTVGDREDKKKKRKKKSERVTKPLVCFPE
jgi:hypothetical protein